MNISGPAAVAKPEMLFYAPGDLTVTFNASIRRFSKIVNIYFTYLHKNILREEGGDWLKI